MVQTDAFFAAQPYSWMAAEKKPRFLEVMNAMVAHHCAAGEQYGKIISMFSGRGRESAALEEVPYLPVRIFKEHRLKSIPDDQVLKTMTSSGTTGQSVSKIFLDKTTSMLQTKALANIMKSYLGNTRLPMVILDTRSVLKDPKQFSARGAGILGLSFFGHDHFYAFDEQMSLDMDGLEEFLGKHGTGPILFFGFTFMIWLHFYQELKKKGIRLGLRDGILIHAGGWKKLVEMAVDNDVFKSSLHEVCGNIRIYNFYGMVEQTGSVYMECEEGFFHASNFSQIIIRDTMTHRVLGNGEKGLIETMSVLPWSYPGHAILTEDLGMIHGEDDCACGRYGKYFTFQGRLPKAETRGCSDTYAVEQKF